VHKICSSSSSSVLGSNRCALHLANSNRGNHTEYYRDLFLLVVYSQSTDLQFLSSHRRIQNLRAKKIKVHRICSSISSSVLCWNRCALHLVNSNRGKHTEYYRDLFLLVVYSQFTDLQFLSSHRRIQYLTL
jgi:hypothetical protein